MSPARADLVVYQGETLEDVGWTFYEGAARALADLTGFAFHWVARAAAGAAPVFELRDDLGTLAVDLATARVAPAVTAAQTAAWPLGTYEHELWMEGPADAPRHPVAVGLLTVRPAGAAL